MDEIFCTDLTSFVKEEVILEDTGSTSSSDVDVPSPISESEEIVNVRKFVKSTYYGLSWNQLLVTSLLFY